MQDPPVPSFDGWVEYCFTLGYRDFSTYGETAEPDEIEPRIERFVSLDPIRITEYLTTLFRAPRFIADRYSDDPIADATWFLFGRGSEYFHNVRSLPVPPDRQIECMSSVATLYTDLFDRVCCKRGSDPNGK